jgi:hypothetical protein
MGISWMRFAGITVSIVLFSIAIWRLRRHSRHRTDVWLLVLSAISLLGLSLFPDLLKVPAQLLALNSIPGGRIITLLILTISVFWALLLSLRAKTAKLSEEMGKLVQTLAIKDFSDADFSVDRLILVLIPVFNERKNIEKVLPEVPFKIFNHQVRTIVIDDGSEDETSISVKRLGHNVIRLPFNQGGGAALKTGYCIAKKVGCDVIVTMDGDGQHDASEMGVLVEPILQDKADVVIGSRVLGKCEPYSLLRSIGVKLFSFFIRHLMGLNITDCSSGYRAFNPEKLYRLQLEQNQYHTAELIIDAAKHGYEIIERPIHIRSRLHDKSKKGGDLKYALSFLRSIIKTWIR